MASAGKSRGATPIGRRGPKTGNNVAERIADTPTALAPALHAQQEAFKALERFGRYHYAVAGDYLEWGVAQARAMFAPCTPAEHLASQTNLATQFGERLQGRVRELVSLASETRATFNELAGDATARFAETIQRFA